MELFSYLLKSAIWLSGFTVIYFLFLRNERFFRLKRIYLISGILFSFVCPLITFHYQVELPVPVSAGASNLSVASEPSYNISQAAPEKGFNYIFILTGLYLAGIILLAFRMIRHFLRMFRAIKKAKIKSGGPVKLVRSSEYASSFSFFNYVFVSPAINENEAEEIMNHELVHVRQKHWFDLLLGETVRLIQWVNPFAWIYTGFIRLNHEYLADEIALQRTADPAVYKAALLNQMFRASVISLTNPFNYSINKTRFDMMKKIINSPYRKLRILLVLPVFAIVFYAFAQPEYHYTASNYNMIQPTEAISVPDLTVKGEVLKEDGSPLQGVTILVSGTSAAVITGSDGKFAIANVPDGATLTFSCKGYLTQSIKVTSKDMVIRMVKDPVFKEEVKVTGYGTKSESAGTLTIANAADGSTVNALIIIDGLETNRKDLKGIDPNSIESMSVLKDESATRVFGEKGKNGVIIVRTRSGANNQQNVPLPQQYQMPPRVVMVDGVLTDKNAEQIRKELGYNYGMTNMVRGIPVDGKPGVDTVKILTRKKALEMGLKPPFPRLAPEDYPTFQGKQHSAFKDWFSGQIRYPAQAREKNIEGWVSINFKVQLDGSLTDIQSTIAVDQILSDEVIRVIKSSPKWDPPKNRNVDEPFMGSVTMSFKLPDQILMEAPFVVVEKMPMYPGGDGELLKYIADNIVYPVTAKEEKIQGRVILRFVVSKEGKTEAVSVLKGVHPLLDEEAIRVTRSISGWVPGEQGGVPVNVWYMVPITFTLSGSQESPSQK